MGAVRMGTGLALTARFVRVAVGLERVLRATDPFAGVFLATVFLVAAFFAKVFLATGFLVPGFFAPGFFAASFFATGFLEDVDLRATRPSLGLVFLPHSLR